LLHLVSGPEVVNTSPTHPRTDSNSFEKISVRDLDLFLRAPADVFDDGRQGAKSSFSELQSLQAIKDISEDGVQGAKSSTDNVFKAFSTGTYKCAYPGCTAPPFQTQYLLK
jgi:hypothetical protein